MPEPFVTFLAAYQAACSRFDVDAVLGAVAKDYASEYFYPGGVTRTFDRAALAESWRAAAEYFGGAGARLEYENVAVARREDERVVASWVAFIAERQTTGHSFLLSTFQETPNGWKLTREHMEHRVERM